MRQLTKADHLDFFSEQLKSFELLLFAKLTSQVFHSHLEVLWIGFHNDIPNLTHQILTIRHLRKVSNYMKGVKQMRP